MLECPLYTDPGLYDLLFPTAAACASIQDEARRARTVASERFYVEEAGRNAGRVLELACGSGRLTIPIAQSGVEIVGVDLSPSMLAAARAKAAAARVAVPFLEADMRAFELPGHFSTILIPGNSLLHLLTLDHLKQCLASVRRHLAAGGRLVFDVSKWDLHTLARNPAERRPVLSVAHPQRGQVAIEETALYDAAAQVLDVKWYLSAPSAADFRVIEYRLRVIFPQELSLLLEAAGFRLQTRYGEFTREPFVSSSPRQVCICSPTAG